MLSNSPGPSVDSAEVIAMQFLLLIFHPESEWMKLDAAEQSSIYAEYRQLMEDLSRNGKFLAGDQLKPAATAATVRVRNGKAMRTDGPFAETKEQLGGYFLVDVAGRDEALAIAARIPSARLGSVEVREISSRHKLEP